MSRHRRWLRGATLAALSVVLLFATTAAGQSGGGPPHADAGGGKVWESCSEYIPDGATRPGIEAKLPERTFSGYAAELEVKVSHGAGETVMPDGFHIQRGSDAMDALRKSGWVIPEPDGGAAPVIERAEPGAQDAVSIVRIPFVPLPEEPGRHLMQLPPMPISVARANGQVMTLCTPPLITTVEDPIANEVDPEVKRNASPRPQTEEWTQAKNFTYGALIVIALGLLLAWLILRYRARPVVEPPKPKVLPWIAAMRDLEALKQSSLLEAGNFDEYFDRVEHTTRTYLGERYGFDGLESTSDEIKRNLSRVYPAITDIERINQFLADGDFVKYAEVTPTLEDCEGAMQRAHAIVLATKPPNAERLEQQRKPKQKRRRKRRKGKAA